MIRNSDIGHKYYLRPVIYQTKFVGLNRVGQDKNINHEIHEKHEQKILGKTKNQAGVEVW
jgi:hypothetical protein